jgi:transposase InsO family protein
MILTAIEEAVGAGARLSAACGLVGLSARTVQRWKLRPEGDDLRQSPRRRPGYALTDEGIAQRQPQGVIHHSDHGCQYTAAAFGQRCHQAGVRPSMGTVGDAHDNAMCESFLASLECELLDRHTLGTHVEARMALFRCIEGRYNPYRRHSILDYQ